MDAHKDLRSVVVSENVIPEITPHLLRHVETLLRAKETNELKQDSAKRYADNRLREQDCFRADDKVLVETPIKLVSVLPPNLHRTLLLFALCKEEAVQGKAPEEIRQPLETMNGSHMPSHTHHHPDQNVRNEFPGVSEMVASMYCSDLIHMNPPRVLEKAAHVLTSNFLSHSPRRRSDPKGEAVTRGLATILHPW
ncbi:hypothetical protein JTB14_005627 [Gonioctena quinquepunctata]|nr:hypothetical protein JTB14_005627 [Gonioctena quinquepunctata]